MTAPVRPDLSNPAHVRDLPAAVVRSVLVALARRGINPEIGPYTMAKAVPAAQLLLMALDVEFRATAEVVDLEAYRRTRKAVG